MGISYTLSVSEDLRQFLTCEDAKTHKYSQVTILDDEVDQVLEKGIRSYTLQQLTEEVWKRSRNVQVTIRADPRPFMVCLSCDKRGEPKRLIFYGQCTGADVSTAIFDSLAQSDEKFSIGNGYPKPSTFNRNFIFSRMA